MLDEATAEAFVWTKPRCLAIDPPDAILAKDLGFTTAKPREATVVRLEQLFIHSLVTKPIEKESIAVPTMLGELTLNRDQLTARDVLFYIRGLERVGVDETRRVVVGTLEDLREEMTNGLLLDDGSRSILAPGVGSSRHDPQRREPRAIHIIPLQVGRFEERAEAQSVR